MMMEIVIFYVKKFFPVVLKSFVYDGNVLQDISTQQAFKKREDKLWDPLRKLTLIQNPCLGT